MNKKVGSINESGYVNAMDRKGINHSRALAELFGNSLDSGCTSIIVDVCEDKGISLIDDGEGMDNEKLKFLWESQRENHKNEKTTGVSGFGAKPSTKILSENKKVIYFTKSKKDGFLKSITPWDKIVKKGKYSDMITIDNMNKDDIDYFNKFLEGKTGTIIYIPYTD